MSREIKFRAWQWLGDKGEIVPADDLMSGDPDVLHDALLGLSQGDMGLTAMQFTGLQDKNGRDIYEGDILRYWREADGADFPGLLDGRTRIVKWRVTAHHNGWNVSKGRDGCHWEVIGNIYENPELLEKAA